MVRLFLLFVAASALLACGGNVVVDGTGTGTGGSTSSCGAPGALICELNAGMPGHACAAVTGLGMTTCAMGVQVMCCPTANALGTCSVSVSSGTGTVTESVTYYSDGGFTATVAAMSCTSTPGATWTPA